MAEKKPYARLFSPLSVGPLTLRNRIVMSPMVTNMSHSLVIGPQVGSDQAHAWYVARARGGVGLIIREGTLIQQLADPAFTGKLKRTVDAVHSAGAAIAAQIGTHGTTATNEAFASLPWPKKAEERLDLFRAAVTEATEAELLELISLYAKASKECRRVGFDGVEMHGGHGWFLNQFFSPVSNTRADAFGGSLEKRMEMGLRIVRAIRQAVDDDCLILYRHTPKGTRWFAEGYSLEDSRKFVKELEKAGVDILDVSSGTSSGQAPRADMAGALKEAVVIPVIAVGSFGRDLGAAESVLMQDQADLIAIGRGLIADPELPNKLLDGREIIECRECNEKCLHAIMSGKVIGCVQNERSGKEYLYMEP